MRESRGFSLVELSIVLVILGLLTGGILAGRSLVRASELRTVTTDYNRYITAFHAFRDKYFGLPGDITNASSIWGAADGLNGNNGSCQTSTAAGTCNGNGDGMLYSTTAYASREEYRAWQQLVLAGLIDGSYTGVVGPAHVNGDVVPGVNAPASKLGNATFGSVSWLGSVAAGNTYYYPGSWGNVIGFGADNTVNGAGVGMAALTADEAWNVDTKMDDGLPQTGKVRTWRYGAGTDVARWCAASSDTAYGLDQTGIRCSLIFVTGF